MVFAQTSRLPSQPSSEHTGQLRTRCQEADRTVFVLFHEHGQPYEEIAEALGRPVGTVKTWLHRARLEVLEQLRKRGMLAEVNNELS